jgi:hypothetical protein
LHRQRGMQPRPFVHDGAGASPSGSALACTTVSDFVVRVIVT